MMDQQTVEFLIRAKQATYAGKGAETTPSRGKSHDLVYRDGDYMYYDTYLGGEEFAGEEALWISGIPYWSMNYIGRVTGENFSGDFLKEALLRVPEENPYRGPREYTNGDYTYRCENKPAVPVDPRFQDPDDFFPAPWRGKGITGLRLWEIQLLIIDKLISEAVGQCPPQGALSAAVQSAYQDSHTVC